MQSINSMFMCSFYQFVLSQLLSNIYRKTCKLHVVNIERVESSMYGWLNWKLSRNINSHESRRLPPIKWAASFTVLLSCYTIPKWSRKCAFSKFKNRDKFLASFELGNNKNNYRLRLHELRCTDVILHTDRARESFK